MTSQLPGIESESIPNETLKNEVRDYWNAHPCGTQFTELQWGSREFFDAVEKHRYETQPFMATLMEFDKFRGKKLLEVGCGLGTDLLQFARGGAEVTGIDLTPASIDLVRKRFKLYGMNVDARVGDAEHLPFDDNTFDVVYSFGVLHHTPNTQQAIREIHRVLKPGGRTIIMLYHKQSMHVRLGMMYQKYLPKRDNGRLSEEDWVRVYDGEDNPLGKAYTRGEVKTMFQQFRQIRLASVDPYRRNLPRLANELNQTIFASWWGFWLVIKGEKATK